MRYDVRMPPPASPAPPRHSNLQLLRRLIGIGLESRVPCGLMVAFNVMLVGLALGGLGLTGLGIDYLRHVVDPTSAPPQWPWGLEPPATLSPFAVVCRIAAGILALSVGGAALKFTGTLAAAALSQRILIRLRTEVYDKLQQLSFRFYDAGESSSIINRAAADANAVRMFIDGVMVRTLTVVLTLGA